MADRQAKRISITPPVSVNDLPEDIGNISTEFKLRQNKSMGRVNQVDDENLNAGTEEVS